MGLSRSSVATILVAYPPWLAPNTVSPTLNFGVLPLGRDVGALRMTPENSEPDIQGKGG